MWEELERKHLTSIVDSICQIWSQSKFTWAFPKDESKDPDLKAPETFIRLSYLRYAEHVIRMENNRFPKILLPAKTNEGQIRRIGCPRKNFRQCLKEHLKVSIFHLKTYMRKLIIDGARTFQDIGSMNTSVSLYEADFTTLETLQP